MKKNLTEIGKIQGNERVLYPIHTIKTCLIKQSLMKPCLIKKMVN